MELKQIAIHEAGHVVVAYALGLAVKEVALTHEAADDTGLYGYAIGPNPVHGYNHDSRRECREAVRDECIVCCAGLAAENVFFNVPLSTDNENAQGDFRNIIEFESDSLLHISGKRGGWIGDDATWRYISRRLIDARRLVKRHRHTIQRLAHTLIERKKLNGEEVQRLLTEWMPT
jgi:ATP-dependent Zn protease